MKDEGRIGIDISIEKEGMKGGSGNRYEFIDIFLSIYKRRHSA